MNENKSGTPVERRYRHGQTRPVSYVCDENRRVNRVKPIHADV